MLVALITCARAAIPVITEGDQDAAVAMVAERTEVAPDNLAAVDATTLLNPGLGDAVPCSGPPLRRADLDAQLAAVQASYDTGEVDEAREKAGHWRTELACLVETVDPGWMWSAAFVTGYLAWEKGDREAARQAWIGARTIDRQRPWDDNFTPTDTAQSVFGTAFADHDFALDVVGGAVLVDGRPAGDRITPGLHLVQSADPPQTWLVDVRAPVLVVHPHTTPSRLTNDQWLVVVAARMPAEDLVYVVRPDTAVALDMRTKSVRELPAPVPPPAKKKWGRWVAAGGSVLAAGALIDLLAFSRPAAVDAADRRTSAFDDGDVNAFNEADADLDTAQTRIYIDYTVLGVGLGLIVVATPNLLSREQ